MSSSPGRSHWFKSKSPLSVANRMARTHSPNPRRAGRSATPVPLYSDTPNVAGSVTQKGYGKLTPPYLLLQYARRKACTLETFQ